jgi:hypothetical protein
LFDRADPVGCAQLFALEADETVDDSADGHGSVVAIGSDRHDVDRDAVELGLAGSETGPYAESFA